MKQIVSMLCLYFLASFGYAWNAMGHKLVAQIAYDNLSTKAKKTCHKYLRSRKYNSANLSFVGSSTWMDQIRTKKIYWYDTMHYINIPFIVENSSASHININNPNAVWAIKQAIVVFTSKRTNFFEKQLALRMLIHIIGDIHQPLHAATRISIKLPQGDAGGNLFPLGENSIADNLHHYWDNGGGYFFGRYDERTITKIAHKLEKKWPCSLINLETDPEKWAKISYSIALRNAYKINPNDIPNSKYQKSTREIVQKQVAFAGCRLAALLNRIIVSF